MNLLHQVGGLGLFKREFLFRADNGAFVLEFALQSRRFKVVQKGNSRLGLVLVYLVL
jgi:hypothetical protein